MSLLYINENGATVSIESNRIIVNHKDGLKTSCPLETVEGIILLGAANITTPCIKRCLTHGIPVSFFSKGGSYFGRVVSTGHIKASLQRKQSALYDTDFALQLSKRIMEAKMQNQLVVMKRYGKSRRVDLSECEKMIHIGMEKVLRAESIPEVIGYEGMAAKYYFQGLAKCVEKDFYFQGRSRRPPRDEFNSMLSLGYSMLMNELYGEIEMAGLNPYFGFVHRDAEKHPTLASDLMEEWRAVIVDSVVMSMINGHEIFLDDFTTDIESPGYFLTKEGLKKFLSKMDKKMLTTVKYLSYVNYPVSFRRGIALQIEQLVHAIQEEDAEIYQPIRIR